MTSFSPSLALSPKLDTQTNLLLQLLTQVILADGHIFPSEIEALVQGVTQLDLKDQYGIPLSNADVRAWFGSYQSRLNAERVPLRPDVALSHLILKLSGWPKKQAVIDVLTDISLSDDDFHIEEKKLISLVRAFWQYEGLETRGATIRP